MQLSSNRCLLSSERTEAGNGKESTCDTGKLRKHKGGDDTPSGLSRTQPSESWVRLWAQLDPRPSPSEPVRAPGNSQEASSQLFLSKQSAGWGTRPLA